jgi:hypothetical protein
MEPLYEVEERKDKNGRPMGYFLDGERLISVTRALSILDKPALKGWAWRIAVAGSAEIPPMQRTYAEQEKALVAAGHGWWQVRNEAALRGSDMHKALSALIETGEPPDLDQWPEEQHGYVQALASYWVENQPRLLFAEMPVASKRHRYGGKPDLIRLDENGVAKVVDFKSGKADEWGDPRPPFLEAHLQVGAYEWAFFEQFNLSLIPEGEIVPLCENGSYDIFPCVADPEGFPKILDAARYVKETEQSMQAMQKRRDEDD